MTLDNIEKRKKGFAKLSSENIMSLGHILIKLKEEFGDPVPSKQALLAWAKNAKQQDEIFPRLTNYADFLNKNYITGMYDYEEARYMFENYYLIHYRSHQTK